MPETRLNNFRKQYPMYENVSDDSLLTAIHKKSYSNIEYDTFLDAFSKKFGDDARKPEDSYLKGFGEEIVRQVTDVKPSPVAEMLGAIPQTKAAGLVEHGMKAVDLFSQLVPTALIPHDDETPAERLKRQKRPGEFLITDEEIAKLKGPAKSYAYAAKGIVDFGADLFLALPAVKAISNALRTGQKITKVSVNEVRKILRFDQNQKLLREGAKTKALPPLSDEAIIQVIKDGQAAEVGGQFVGKATTTPLKQITAGPATTKVTATRGGPFEELVNAPTKIAHAEGIAKSQAKLAGLKDVKPRLKTKVTTGRFAKVEPIEVTPAGKPLLTESQRNTLRQARTEIAEGEPGERIMLLDAEGYQDSFIGKSSTYPEFFKDKGYTKKESLKLIDKALEGKKLTERQRIIVEDLNQGIRERFARELREERFARDIESTAARETEIIEDIPEFTSANKTQDALALGERLKGNEEGIARLREIEAKITKEFNAIRETGDFNELAVISHRKQLYREAREVATGEGGAAEFVAKEKPLDLEKEFIKEQAVKGKKATTPTVAARQAAKEKLAADVKAGKEDLFTVADKKKQTTLLSGKDFSKGIREAIGKDIKGEKAGIVADPYRNLRSFLKENKLKLTPEEMARISNFAKKLAKEGIGEGARARRFEEYLTKNFKDFKFEKARIQQTAPPNVAATPPPTNLPGDAERFRAAFNQSKAEFEAVNKTTVKGVYQASKRNIVDVSGNIKKKLLKTPEGKQAVIKHDLIAGSHPRATLIFNKKRELIYDKLSQDELNTLDAMIDARRTITIDSYKEGVSHHFGVTGADAKALMESLPKSTVEKLVPRMNEYFKTMRETLKKRLDNGLITQEQFDELVKYDYSPRKFIQYAGEQQVNIGGKIISVPNSGLKSLQEGSEQAMQVNSRVLLSDVVNQTENIVARNKANQALYKFAQEVPDNGVVQLGKKKGGFTEVGVMIEGKKQSMYLPNDMAIEWVKSDPAIAHGLASFFGWVSGSKILKPMATGLNPMFSMTNFPRDLAHIYLTTDQYSSFAPAFTAQFARDLAVVAKDAILRKGSYIDYIKEGGGMEFLTHQGKVTSRTGGALKKVQDILGYFGETSEIITRLALRKRALRKGLGAEEATWVARNYLDFSQGGRGAKAVDTAVPYFNAAIQGTRGVFRAAATTPKKFLWKVGNIGVAASAIYLYNRESPAWDQIPMRDKVNNWIITTPFKFQDKDGNDKYFYFKVAKDQGQRAFATIFENMMAKVRGDEVNPEEIVSAVQEMIPGLDMNFLPPTIKALIGYASNVDFWRKEAIWKGPKVEPSSEKTRYTHPFFTAAGEKTGLSPTRLERGAEQIITSGNIYTSASGEIWNYLMEKADTRTQNLVTEELILNKPGVRRFITSTRPTLEAKKTFAEVEIEANTRKFNQNFEFDEKLRKDFDTGKASRSDIIKHILDLDISREDKLRLRDRFKRWVKFGDVPNKSNWIKLSFLDPEARAYVFYTQFKGKTPEEQRELKRLAKKTGIASKRFIRAFNQLNKE